MAAITDSQFKILENEIQDNVNLKEKLDALLKEVREAVLFEIHDSCRSMTKTTDADEKLFADYEALDCASWTADYINLIALDALRDLANKTIVKDVAKNIANDQTE